MSKKLTQEQAIEKFKAVHGNKYDYSQVKYLGEVVRVKIICPKHGEFWQIPANHKQGRGCKKCGYEFPVNKYFTPEIIDQFKATHGDRYDYSQVEYVGDGIKVKIVCRIHGVFEQKPHGHKRGQGCKKCLHESLKKPKYTTRQIVDEFKKIHGDRFDYSLVDFIGSTHKVKIICRIHGVFEQLVGHHRVGDGGCVGCMYDDKRHSRDWIVEQFTIVHGNAYDYSLVEYINNRTKVKIICSEHGVFEQAAYSHLTGAGCSICAGNNQLNTEQAIEQFKQVHGNKYGYSLVEYVSTFKKVKIKCPEHGIFEQTPDSHKRGAGCSNCVPKLEFSRSNYIEACLRHQGKSYLYLIKCAGNDESFYKVGIACKGATDRFNSKNKLPYDFEILKQIRAESGYIWDLEKRIHGLLKKYHYSPSLQFGGSVNECFTEIPASVLKLLDEIDSEQLQLIA